MECTGESLRKNYPKYYIDKTADSLLRRMCAKKGGSVGYLVSECSKKVSFLNPGKSVHISDTRSSRLLLSRERLLVTDVSTASAAVIFRVKKEELSGTVSLFM